MSDDTEITALLQRLVDDEPPLRTALGPALQAAQSGGRRRRRAQARGLAVAVPAVAVATVLGLGRLGSWPDAVGPEATVGPPSLDAVVHRIGAAAGGTLTELEDGTAVRLDREHGSVLIVAGLDGLPAPAELDAQCRRGPSRTPAAPVPAAVGRTCTRVYLRPGQGLWLYDWAGQRPGAGPDRMIGQTAYAVAELPDGHRLVVTLQAPPRRTVFDTGITPDTVREVLAAYTG